MILPSSNALFDPSVWSQALESYGRACHLTVKVFDADGRVVVGPVHPTPFYELLEEGPAYETGMFAECARLCLAQTDTRPAVVVSEFYGLSVVGTSFVLDGHVVGAAVAGYAFVDFAQLSEVQRFARNSGISFERLWQAAHEQKPVPRSRLLLNGELLQVLGDALLRENSRTRRYEATVLQLEEAVRARDAAHQALQRTTGALRRLNEESAVLLDRERRIAAAFQDASLPSSLPQLSGLRFDATYAPGRSEAHVGGDWYDAVQLIDGRVIVSIGDVAGSGLRAAVTMGNTRQIIRGVAQMRADPALVLDAADRALRMNEDEPYVTVFVGIIDVVAGTLTYSSAGHPPAFLRYSNGEIASLSGGGLPLGLRPGRAGETKVVSIPEGSCLVLYTDGLTESGRDALAGEALLKSLISDGSFRADPAPAASLAARFLGKSVPHDDVAVLVVEILGLPAQFGIPPYRWRFHTDDADAAGCARREIIEAFEDRGANRQEIDDAQAVLNEMLANVVRHAPGPVEIALDWTSKAPIIHVFDSGSGFSRVPSLPTNPLSESGRGLFIASALAEMFDVSRRPTGGSHTRAVLKQEIRRRTVAPEARRELVTEAS